MKRLYHDIPRRTQSGDNREDGSVPYSPTAVNYGIGKNFDRLTRQYSKKIILIQHVAKLNDYGCFFTDILNVPSLKGAILLLPCDIDIFHLLDLQATLCCWYDCLYYFRKWVK